MTRKVSEEVYSRVLHRREAKERLRKKVNTPEYRKKAITDFAERSAFTVAPVVTTLGVAYHKAKSDWWKNRYADDRDSNAEALKAFNTLSKGVAYADASYAVGSSAYVAKRKFQDRVKLGADTKTAAKAGAKAFVREGTKQVVTSGVRLGTHAALVPVRRYIKLKMSALRVPMLGQAIIGNVIDKAARTTAHTTVPNVTNSALDHYWHRRDSGDDVRTAAKKAGNRAVEVVRGKDTIRHQRMVKKYIRKGYSERQAKVMATEIMEDF